MIFYQVECRHSTQQYETNKKKSNWATQKIVTFKKEDFSIGMQQWRRKSQKMHEIYNFLFRINYKTVV